jgi:cell wall-associated NlpC family hydrolase
VAKNALWRCFLVFSLLVATFLATATVASAAGPVPLGNLQPGNIIFMRNPTDAWAKLTNWTHNGLYVGPYSGPNGAGKNVNYQYAIVEATSRGVVVNDIANAGHWWTVYNSNPAKPGYAVAAKRLAADNAAAKQAAVTYAQKKVGTRYDYLSNRKTDTALYCSEMVWWSYWQNKLDLDHNGGSMIWPDDGYESPLVKAAT